MTWLRVSDDFMRNQKIGALTDGEFRVWLRLLCYCAEVEDPTVDEIAVREVAGLSKKRLARFATLRLLDPVGACFEVHDWAEYLPRALSSTERQAAWRARKRNEPVDEIVTSTVTERDAGVDGRVDENVTDFVTSLARARVPVPVPVPLVPSAVDVGPNGSASHGEQHEPAFDGEQVGVGVVVARSLEDARWQ